MSSNNNKLYGLCVEVSSHCNYRCVGCPSLDLPRGRGHMDENLFSDIFKEAGNELAEVALWTYGEPLLHPKITNMIEGIGKYNCRKKLSTTGYKLEDFSNLSFLGNLDELIISINGLDEQTYNQHQVGGDLNKVLRGIDRLSEIPNNVGLTMQVVANKHNVSQIPEFRKFAKKKGFDKLVVKSFNVMDYNPETFNKLVPIKTNYSRYTSSNPISVPSDLKKVLCKGGMIIGWNGNAYPCCFDYKGDYNIGDIKKSGVYGVWNSKEARLIRNQIKNKNLLEICKTDCSSTRELLEEEL